MKRSLVLFFLLTLAASARLTAQSWPVQQPELAQAAAQPASVLGAPPVASAPPKSFHDFFTDRLKEYFAFEKSRGGSAATGTTPLLFVSVDGKQGSVRVNEDGTLTLDGLSTEDALLLAVSLSTDRTMEEERAWDAERKAKADPPPPLLKTTKGAFRVQDTPDIWKGYTLGDTNCGLRRVRTLETRSDKRATVLHEMMHVATNCNRDPALHRAITQMAPALLKLMRDNPDTVRWLMGGAPSAQGERQGGVKGIVAPPGAKAVVPKDDGAKGIAMPPGPKEKYYYEYKVLGSPKNSDEGKFVFADPTDAPSPWPEALDESPVKEEYGNPGDEVCDMGNCVRTESPDGKRRTRLTCADKSRFLLTSEDGKGHCIKLGGLAW